MPGLSWKGIPIIVAEPLLHLASSSPRRRDILAALGIEHSWQGVDIDERPLPGEQPGSLVLRLALAKAREARRLRPDDGVILGADTVVVLGDKIFGKAASKEEALAMLSSLSGRRHAVFTGVAVTTLKRELTAVSETAVRMRRIEPEEALRYWQSGEPAGKAGAYAIQGLGGVFVESLSGSWSGVVGLPVFETAALLEQAGIEVLPGPMTGLCS